MRILIVLDEETTDILETSTGDLDIDLTDPQFETQP